LYKRLYRYGFVVYLLLLVFAIVFYVERTIFLDIAYHLFSIVKNNGFAIQAFRFGAAFTQAFPVAGVKLSLPLESIMLMYSAGFIIYYTACYWICGSVLKQYEIAIVLLLFNIMLVSKTFFWMQAELPQGCAFMLAMFAMLKSTALSGKDKGKLIMLLPVILMAVSFHPIIWIPAFFVIAYFSLNTQYLVDKRLFWAGSILFIILFYVKTKVFVNPYDAVAISQRDNMLRLFPNWVNLASNRILLANFLGKFIWMPVSVLLISGVYIMQRKWLQLVLVGGALGSYLLLINTTYPHDNTPEFYIENLYLPVALILGLPLVYDVFPVLEKRKLLLPVFLLIILSGLGRIYMSHHHYAERVNWERKFLAQHKDEKLLVAATKPMLDTLTMTWGTPYEFWLLSTTEHNKTASIVITDNIEGIEYTHWERMSFVTQWGVFPYTELPARYFIFTDTVNRYRVIK
jgi:hypothetical protein